MSENKKSKKPIYSFRLDPKLVKSLDTVAEMTGANRSQILNDALHLYMNGGQHADSK